MALDSVPVPEEIFNGYGWQTLVEFTLAREAVCEPTAIERVAEAVQTLDWPKASTARLGRALARATRHAREESSLEGPGAPVIIRVLMQHGAEAMPYARPTADELDQQQRPGCATRPVAGSSSRGWGSFLVQRTEDDPNALGGSYHVIEVFLYQE